MKIEIAIEYDTETGKAVFKSNQANLHSSAAIATAMRANIDCAEVVLMAVGAYMGEFMEMKIIGDKVMDVACTTKEVNDILKAKRN